LLMNASIKSIRKPRNFAATIIIDDGASLRGAGVTAGIRRPQSSQSATETRGLRSSTRCSLTVRSAHYSGSCWRRARKMPARTPALPISNLGVPVAARFLPHALAHLCARHELLNHGQELREPFVLIAQRKQRLLIIEIDRQILRDGIRQ
jgi:hypothetical protein